MDRAIVRRDAHQTTGVEIGERIDVSDRTVRNRIEALEDQGTIGGYALKIETSGVTLSRSKLTVRTVLTGAVASH